MIPEAYPTVPDALRDAPCPSHVTPTAVLNVPAACLNAPEALTDVPIACTEALRPRRMTQTKFVTRTFRAPWNPRNLWHLRNLFESIVSSST
jgi:hypothetical protein